MSIVAIKNVPHPTDRFPLMTIVYAFLMISLDGYYQTTDGDLSWNVVDEEFMTWNVRENEGTEALLLGRKTFEHFKDHWTSEVARDQMPEVTRYMNGVTKVVVSNSMTDADWTNSRVVRGSALAQTVATLREETDGDVGVFGSTGLTVSLLEQGLLDEVRVIVNPVLLGSGDSAYSGLDGPVELEPGPTTVFRSGNVLLSYRPRNRPNARMEQR